MGVPDIYQSNEIKRDYFLNKHWQQRKKDLKSKGNQEPMKLDELDQD